MSDKKEASPTVMDAMLCELQCPVCLELLQHPVVFPCSHVLCHSPCAERLFDHGFVRCPVCRENSFVCGGVDSLPRVKSLENIIDYCRRPPPVPAVLVTSSDVDEEAAACTADDDIACQLCDAEPHRKAIKSCVNCSASYCQRCLRLSHPNREPFSSHQLVQPGQYREEGGAGKEQLLCPRHGARVNVYCSDCRTLGCLLCADDGHMHPNHRILSLAEAGSSFKKQLEDLLPKLKSAQENAGRLSKFTQEQLQTFLVGVSQKRDQLNTQCDALAAEVEAKRRFFLSDLEYEEHSKRDAAKRCVTRCDDTSRDLQLLLHSAREVLRETDHCTFIQLAKSLSDRVKQTLEDSVDPCPSSPTASTLHQKIIDLRKEKAVLRDMTYLTPPPRPSIDVSRCSRSTQSIVLVLQPPVDEHCVLDGYEVIYCTQEQKELGQQATMTFRTPGEERKCGRGLSSNSVCLIHNNLRSGTTYYFCVRAFNAAGSSDMSEVVGCTTLSYDGNSLPVPEISEALCRTYTSSIQLHSASPLTGNTGDTGVIHYLLYREASVNKIWKSIPLCCRVEHRVFGLESDTVYDLAIMACNRDGACNVSNIVTLKTECAAY